MASCGQGRSWDTALDCHIGCQQMVTQQEEPFQTICGIVVLCHAITLQQEISDEADE
jgi:hypothetical protein